MARIRSIVDVVDWRLCTGCGACLLNCQNDDINMRNIPGEGIRPDFRQKNSKSFVEALEFCPGYKIRCEYSRSSRPGSKNEILVGREFGVWEGYAADEQIREKGSSGGLISAIAAYCLENEGFGCVIHSGMSSEAPWLNETVISRTRDMLLTRTGSRYCPSSPCDGLKWVEKEEKPCIFIGKPCDVAAVQALKKVNETIKEKIGLTLTFFCAGTPPGEATVALLNNAGIDPARVSNIVYRGAGWPGKFTAKEKNGEEILKMSYMDSWSFLAKNRPMRCYLCADGLGQMADISCGDAWHRIGESDSPGLSFAVARTSLGRTVLENASAKDYVCLTPSDSDSIIVAQGLVKRKKELFGRYLILRLFNIPTPKYEGFWLFKAWLDTGIFYKVRGMLGTIKRILKRRLYVPRVSIW